METAHYPDRVLQTFTKISQSILNKSSPEEGFPEILQEACQLLEADAGLITKPSKNSEEDGNSKLVPSAHYDQTEEIIDALESVEAFNAGEGITGQAFKKREIFEVNDISNDGLFDNSFHEELIDDLETILAIPLIVHSESVGVVNLYYRFNVDIDKQRKKLLKALAKQSGITIRQAEKIQQLRAKNQRLRIKAATDKLTGLPNQGKIVNILKQELERSRRYQKPITVMMVDIDRFKSINDRYGHLVGDKALERISDYFEDEIRVPDSVGRYGGEEFLFILPETVEEEAKNLSERIRDNLEQRKFNCRGSKFSLTISSGLAEKKYDQSLTHEELIDRADRALLKAKRNGRNCTVEYSSLDSVKS